MEKYETEMIKLNPDLLKTSCFGSPSVIEFVRWYNETHRHSGICFVTPAQRHSGEEHSLLDKRKACL